MSGIYAAAAIGFGKTWSPWRSAISTSRADVASSFSMRSCIDGDVGFAVVARFDPRARVGLFFIAAPPDAGARKSGAEGRS